MDIPDVADPRIVYRFNFVRRVWFALWLGKVEIAKVPEPTATDQLIALAYEWRDTYQQMCDTSHEEQGQ